MRSVHCEIPDTVDALIAGWGKRRELADARHLRMVRGALQLSQRDFARRLGCHASLVALIETGRRRLSERLRCRLNVVLG